MKSRITISLPKISAVAVAVLLGGAVYAGQAAESPKSPAQPQQTSLKPTAAELAAACPGSTIVPITQLRASWAKGLLERVQIGTRQVCKLCPVKTIMTTNSLPSGKGIVTSKVFVAKPGTPHDCTAACLTRAKTSVAANP